MKVPRTDHRTDVSLDSALTPMIDVVFQLLIFFLWTSHTSLDERNLTSRIAQSGAGRSEVRSERPLDAEDFQRVVLRLRSDGPRIIWALNGKPLESATAFRTQLLSLMQIRSDLPLLIDPDDGVPMGVLIDAYDRAHEVGWTNVQFTTRAATH